MTPEEKLSKLLKEDGWGSKTRLAKYLNTSLVNITRWLSGNYNTSIPKDLITKIEKYFNKPPGYLLGGEEFKPVSEIPIIGTASCGGVEMNYLQGRGGSALYRGDKFTDNLYCVIANGDSMAPEIEDGDEVICDPDVSPISGDMVHYRLGDESAIKVLWEDDDAHIIQLIPYNQTEGFKTTTIRKDDHLYDEITISKVVAVNKMRFNNRAARLRLIGRS